MPKVKRTYVPKVKGCHECSQRRIHCDRGEPSCAKCTVKGVRCSGLGIRYRFNDDRYGNATSRCDDESVPQANTSPESKHNTIPNDQEENQAHPVVSFQDGNTHALHRTPALCVHDVPPLSSLIKDSGLTGLSPSEDLQPWESYLLLRYATHIAPELVVIDDKRNNWRHLVLQVARVDSVVRDAVLSAAAFHHSSSFVDFGHRSNSIYIRAIHRLQKRTCLELQNTYTNQTTLLALLVLLTTVMVNGSSDFPSLFNMLETALQAAGGEEALIQGELGTFVVKQIRKYRGYAAPLLSQTQGVSRMRLTTRGATLAGQNMADGWQCFMGYYHTSPEYLNGLSAVYELNKQACDIYVARVLAGRNGPPMTGMVEEFVTTLQCFPTDGPGEHTLVFATFLAAAEAASTEHRGYLKQALLKHYQRNGFMNILLALRSLEEIWSGCGDRDWTQYLPQLRTFIA